MRLLAELDIECPPHRALNEVLELIKRHDPDAGERRDPELVKVLRSHSYLLALLIDLKKSGKL